MQYAHPGSEASSFQLFLLQFSLGLAICFAFLHASRTQKGLCLSTKVQCFVSVHLNLSSAGFWLTFPHRPTEADRRASRLQIGKGIYAYVCRWPVPSVACCQDCDRWDERDVWDPRITGAQKSCCILSGDGQQSGRSDRSWKSFSWDVLILKTMGAPAKRLACEPACLFQVSG